ncbi:MAG: hypothetical protein U1U88_002173 [Lawsonella clevelandensis]
MATWYRPDGRGRRASQKKGLYEAPEGPNIILFNKWVLPFANPFFKPDYANLNTDVPEREPMIQRHDPTASPTNSIPMMSSTRMRSTPRRILTTRSRTTVTSTSLIHDVHHQGRPVRSDHQLRK